MGKRTCCRACNNSGIYSVVIFIYLSGGSLTASLPDSASDYSGPSFQEISTLLHMPPKNIFDDRPTKLQLYVDLPEDSIARVSIFYKTNIMENMQEIPLIKEGVFIPLNLNLKCRVKIQLLISSQLLHPISPCMQLRWIIMVTSNLIKNH